MTAEEIQEYIHKVAAIIGSLGIIFAARKAICKYLNGICLWIKALVKLPTNAESNSVAIKEIRSKTERIEKAIYNGGKDGILHHMEILRAQSSTAFECAPYPMFVCDEHGNNSQVNMAYRELIQITRIESLTGTQWQQAICGDMKEDYIESFIQASQNGEDFICDVAFQNPLTNEHRGTWKIHAPASPKSTGGYYYVGRFIVALDKTAKEIARAKGWSLN